MKKFFSPKAKRAQKRRKRYTPVYNIIRYIFQYNIYCFLKYTPGTPVSSQSKTAETL